MNTDERTPARRRRASPPLTERDYQDQADFRCALRRFLRFAEEQAREAGITPQQHLLLVICRGHKGYPSVTIGDLAESLQLRHSSTSLLVDRCVKRGLINRVEDPNDRRRAIVSLTSEGQRILDQITHANRRHLQSLEGDLFRDSLRQSLHLYSEAQSALSGDGSAAQVAMSSDAG